MLELVLKKEIIVNKALSRTFGVLVFILLTALGAFVRIPLPFTPVPITLQTFFVLLSGLFLGQSLGALSQLSYICLGVWGLPIFTGAGSGIAYLFGPTGGYLFGFVLVSFLLGTFTKRNHNALLPVFVILCMADLILLSCGTIWLKFIFGYSFKKTLLIGFLPFLPGDLFKALVAAFLYLKFKSRIKEIF